MSSKPPRVAAIVPMRHSSERVPGKNYRDFAGRPLYQRIVQSLVESGVADEIVIDTDSELIQEQCRESLPEVKLLARPEHLRAGDTPMNEVLLDTVKRVDADYYLQTHSTNPLLRPDTIRDAVQTFLDRIPMYDSLFTVTRQQTRLWDGLVRPVNHNPAFLLRTQDLPPIYEENSCLYLFTEATLRSDRNRIGARPLMWEIPEEEAQDIDEEIDFRVAELLFKQREGIS